MESTYWITFALGATFAGILTWSACRWWYGRRLAAVAVRLQKAEKARLFATQQTTQARKQIDTLQKGLAKQQHEALAQAQVDRQRARQLEEALKATSEIVEADAYARRPVPAHGFADTQPMM
jgi:sRNA-binding protein